MKEYFLHLCCLSFLLPFMVGCESKKTESLHEVDGPYIYEEKDHLTVISVEKNKDSSYFVKEDKMEKGKQVFTSKVDNKDHDKFSFSLMGVHTVPPAIYPSQEKIFVTSDNEGNFNSFYGMLVSNKVMDKNFNWSFGTGHLVIAGDMFDRGNNVIPCLWLLYKLEQEALNKGGQVHFILGNHEVMNLNGDIRYVQPKYLELAKVLSETEDEKKAYNYLMANNNILIQWIKSKNTIEKIGNALFLHGGISEEIIDANLTIAELNDIVRANISENLYKNPGDDKVANLVLGRFGPLWYRGLVKGYQEYYEKMVSTSVDYVLEHYGVEHIIIGHTIDAKEITSDFEGKVIRVDIKHPKEKFTGKSQALLIENGIYFRVSDTGNKFELELSHVAE